MPRMNLGIRHITSRSPTPISPIIKVYSNRGILFYQKHLCNHSLTRLDKNQFFYLEDQKKIFLDLKKMCVPKGRMIFKLKLDLGEKKTGPRKKNKNWTTAKEQNWTSGKKLFFRDLPSKEIKTKVSTTLSKKNCDKFFSFPVLEKK